MSASLKNKRVKKKSKEKKRELYLIRMRNELLRVHRFEDSSKDEEEKLAYKSVKTIIFFPSNSYMSFEIYLKEIKLFSLIDALGLSWLRSSIMCTNGHMPTQSYQEGSNEPSMSWISRRSQVRGGRRGGLGGRRYYRPQEEYPRHEASHNDKFYENYRDNPNVFQAYNGGYYGNQQGDKALDKIIVLQVQWCGAYCYKYPTKRTLASSEDLNGWMEKSDDDCQEGIVDEDKSSEH
ncbi:hypothetical protein M9H77_07212 [Catharanthus roseus]|uniref:Uncharacterized protein n=1 Tax=Catharanthus roseus TaxID=4058 RepID=A0ACC0BUJ5_CATRO|nr:hypothetical protein M9H77_07212 [Catharanthus roseus]